VLRVHLPWPDKLCWPNGSAGNHRSVAAAKKKLRHAAEWAAIEARQKYGPFEHDGGEIPVKLIVHAKAKGPLPDKDNCVAAAKVMIDAIASQIGVNDRNFAAPVVEFAMPRDGKIIAEIGK
jgi:hypothetical protein